MQALADILFGIVRAEHGLLLAEDLLAGAQVVIEDRPWSDERFVLEAKLIGDECGVGAERGVVDRLGECKSVRGGERIAERALLRSAEGHDAQMWQAAFAF